MFEAKTPIAVRYCETDQMGIVYHSNYFPWFEIGREDHLAKSGLSYAQIEKEGFMLPLAEASCKYRLPAHYADKLVVCTWIEELRVSRIKYGYRIMRDEELIATGSTLHAFTDRNIHPINLKKGAPDIYAALEELAKE